MPCNMSREERAVAVSDLVSRLVGSLAFGDPASAHARAARWLAEDDPLDPPLCPDRDASRLIQRFGLALMNFALGGEENGGGEGNGRGWRYSPSEDQFLKGINECDWAGVDCNSDTKKVTRIELGGRNIRGTLPAELFTVFGDLRVINLKDNLVRGCLPEEISVASSLEFLYLGANKIECGLPRSLPARLQEMELTDNTLRGPIPVEMLTGLENLQTLKLGKNSLTGRIPPKIESLTALRTLHLDQNSLSSSLPSELFNERNLVSLHLNGNSFSSTLPSSISQLSVLEELYLHENSLSGNIPNHLFALEKIRRLALSQNSFGGTLSDQLATATTLEVLRLDANQLIGTVPPSISQLSSLKILSIQGNNFYGDIIDGICALKVDAVASEGNLRRLRANCDVEDGCDESWGVCCTCCDCVAPITRALPVGVVCDPFSGVVQPDGSLPQSSYDPIIQEIIKHGVSDESALLQPLSPQKMAASWLVNDDVLKLNASDTALLQRYTMAVLYFSTNGDSWLQCSATNGTICEAGAAFLSDASVCEWAGISCYGDGNIESIRLEHNGLGGTLPAKELSGLCLQQLSLRGNTGISFDFSSAHLSNLFDKLLELDLSECDLRGELSDSLLLADRVYLNDNRFSGALPSGSYSDVTSLRLQYNELTGAIPESLGLGKSFLELRLDNNFLAGTLPTSLGYLEDLELLTLQNNEFSGAVPDAVCDLTFDNGGKLEGLWADCGEKFGKVEVECSCCSECF